MFAIIVTQLPFLLTVWYSLQSWNLVRTRLGALSSVCQLRDVFSDAVFREAAL